MFKFHRILGPKVWEHNTVSLQSGVGLLHPGWKVGVPYLWNEVPMLSYREVGPVVCHSRGNLWYVSTATLASFLRRLRG